MSELALLVAAALGLASWLVPNHYPPWLSFHAEVTMATAMLIGLGAELSQPRRTALRLPVLTLVILALACVPVVQFLCGTIYFAGDAVMASAYLLAFALAQVLGLQMANRIGAAAVLEGLARLFLVASLLCVCLQFYQWLWLSGLGIFAANLPPGGRPFANVAQPNHLATMLFLGVVGLLYLHDQRRARSWVAVVCYVFLAFGLAMTSSRTAWLAIGGLVVGLWFARRRTGLRITRGAICGVGAVFLFFLAIWHPLNDILLLSAGRTLAIQAQAGPRTLLWSSMLDAISRHPWFGYGWNQGLVAQSQVVVAHPAGGRLIENSHNLLLDLAVWNGVPLGLGLSLFLGWWFWCHLRACRSAMQTFLLAGVAGVFAHAMVEYPLSYTYFLLPVGMMMGALDGVNPPSFSMPMPRWSVALGATVSAALLVAIAADYVKVEPNVRLLRLETARIGTGRIVSEAPDLWLLSELQAYLRFARIETPAAASSEELAWMLKVAERFPYTSSQFRYALASALSGNPAGAQDMLARLCALHGSMACNQSLGEWTRLIQTYPQLASVSLPKRPEGDDSREHGAAKSDP